MKKLITDLEEIKGKTILGCEIDSYSIMILTLTDETFSVFRIMTKEEIESVNEKKRETQNKQEIERKRMLYESLKNEFEKEA